MAAIEVHDLRKRYGSTTAVDGISFAVESAEIFACLGPNGAGKTTTIEILEGYLDRDGGDVQILGMDPRTGGRRLREKIGIVLQEFAGSTLLTVRESVKMFAGYYPKPLDPDKVIDAMGLTSKAGQRVSKLSGGQRRRLDMALAVVGDPELLFLDEPTTGFDPAARREAWELIRQLQEMGKTVLFTTHYMDEAQELADRIMILVNGAIRAEGTPETIGGRDHAPAKIRFALPSAVSLRDLPLDVQVIDGKVVISTTEPTKTSQILTNWATAHGVELGDWSVERPSLEDIYLELTAK
jgi:ABC-2 type transport system ATP-binding protein